MANTGRVPLWLIGLVGGFAAITVLALFFYGVGVSVLKLWLTLVSVVCAMDSLVGSLEVGGRSFGSCPQCDEQPAQNWSAFIYYWLI
jgi:hypothetical protein